MSTVFAFMCVLVIQYNLIFGGYIRDIILCDGVYSNVYDSYYGFGTNIDNKCPNGNRNGSCCVLYPQTAQPSSFVTLKKLNTLPYNNIKLVYDFNANIENWGQCEISYSLDNIIFNSLETLYTYEPSFEYETILPNNTRNQFNVYIKFSNNYIGTESNFGDNRCYFDNIKLYDFTIQPTTALLPEVISTTTTTTTTTNEPSISPTILSPTMLSPTMLSSTEMNSNSITTESNENVIIQSMSFIPYVIIGSVLLIIMLCLCIILILINNIDFKIVKLSQLIRGN